MNYTKAIQRGLASLTVLVLLALSTTAVQAAIPASERTALLNLYTSTNGGSWTTSTNWNGPAGTECTWFRVTCDVGQTTVTRIELYANNLTGSFPSGITSLTNLQVLDLGEAGGLVQFPNHLTGSIPPLTGLTSLQYFDVSGNQLTGSIPVLTGLASLQWFGVENNQLTGSIPAPTGLSNLQFFFVFGNQLTGSIPALTGLTNLQSFDVAVNQLTGSIPPLTGLTNLQYFDVSSNHLTGSIPTLTGLTNLSGFQASGNQLTGSIPTLTGLTNLGAFRVGNNQLTGSIPALTGLTDLAAFNVDNNQLTGSIPALTGLTNLGYFAVDHNQLTGNVPAVPVPNHLYPSANTLSPSVLCPNFLNHTPDPAWDAATGVTPWYTGCTAAPPPSVIVRMVVANGSATSTKIVPGGSVGMDVRADTVSVSLIGTGFRICQTSPPANGFFSITGRSFAGSPFNDTSSGTPDSTVLNPPSNALGPCNGDNLGRTTIGLVGTPPANNMLAANLTLSSSASTPLGTYMIGVEPGVSFATDDAFNDYDMSTATPLSIIVGQTLTVTKSGTCPSLGASTVTADSGAISCGATCSDIYPGTTVTLTATPAANCRFVRWENACTGSGACMVTVNAAKTVNAVFDAIAFPLTVTKSGSGSGTVTSAPTGIACGTTCSAPFNFGTLVTLTPTASAGSLFAGWSGGGCSGTGTCMVTMDAAKTVNAQFDLTPPVLASVVSRRVHGTQGTFNLPLSLVASNPTTEPRQGPAQMIVFNFDKAVTGGTATVTEGTATAGVPTFAGNEMRVPLTGVANQQYVTVAVSNVVAADGGTGGSGSVRIGFLLGDVDQNRVVTVSDLGRVNAQIAQFVGGLNYLDDVNASGTLTVADKAIVNTQITRALPAP